MGATALLATVLWFALVGLIRMTVASESTGVGLVLGLGLSSPVAVAGATAAGWLLWRRFVPNSPDPVRGAIAGGATVLLSLVPVALAFGLWFAVSNLAALTPPELLAAATDFAMIGVLAYMGAVLLTGWLAMPLGVFGGWYHERARRGSTPGR